MLKRFSFATIIFAAAAAPAYAHLDPQEHGSFLAGVTHPLFGLDHILAMVAVGLWASQLATASDRKTLWLVPAAFVGAMAIGFLLALAGVGLPFVEPAILASVVALGLVVALAVRLPASACAAVVGLFALFHGHAHGGELGAATALQYGSGFILATAALHFAGVGLGLAMSHFNPRIARVLGGLTALAGLSLAFG
jgi:urease accessory protein